MIQEIEQRRAVFCLEQFPSANAVDIESCLYVVMGPLIPGRAIVRAG